MNFNETGLRLGRKDAIIGSALAGIVVGFSAINGGSPENPYYTTEQERADLLVPVAQVEMIGTPVPTSKSELEKIATIEQDGASTNESYPNSLSPVVEPVTVFDSNLDNITTVRTPELVDWLGTDGQIHQVPQAPEAVELGN